MFCKPLNIVIGPFESITDPDIIPSLPRTLFFTLVLKSAALFVLFGLKLIEMLILRWFELGLVHHLNLLDMGLCIYWRNLFILVKSFLVESIAVVMYGKVFVIKIIFLDAVLYNWALN